MVGRRFNIGEVQRQESESKSRRYLNCFLARKDVSDCALSALLLRCVVALRVCYPGVRFVAVTPRSKNRLVKAGINAALSS